MPFTAQELENVGAAVLDYHMNTPKVVAQTLQDRPLLQAMESAAKEFPGGKDDITVRVKGAYTTSRLRQMIFGGATSHILWNAEVPVLMAH